MRTLARRVGKAAAVALLAAIGLLAIAHLPPVQRLVARSVETRAGAAIGARLEVGGLDYNLLTRRVTAHNVRLTDPAAAAPFFEAGSIEVQAPLAILRGAREISSLAIDRPSLHLDALRAWLDRRPPTPAGGPSTPFLLRRLRVSGLDIVGSRDGDAAFSMELRELSLDSTPEGAGFTTPVIGGKGWLRAGDYQTTIREVSGQLSFDGARVSLAPLRVVTSDHDLQATGTVGLLTTPAEWEVAFDSTTDVGAVLANWPAAPAAQAVARLSGSVWGPLASPAVTVRATSNDVTLAGATARRVVAEATIASTGDVTITRATAEALGGRLELSGQLRGDKAGDEGLLTLSSVNLTPVMALAGLDVPLSGAASGTLRFRGDVAAPAGWDAGGDLTVRPAGNAGPPVSGRVALALRGGRWRVGLDHGTLGSSAITLDASGLVPPEGRDFTGASLNGRASVSVASVPAFLSDLRRLGVDVPDTVAGRLDGAISLDIDLGGTLSAPDLRTTLEGQSLTVAGIGEVALDGGLELVDARTLAFERVTLVSGARRLALDGRLDTRALTADAALSLEGWSPADLRALGLGHDYLPDAATLAVEGRVTDQLSAPTFQGRLDVRDVKWLGQPIERLSGRLALTPPSRGLRPSRGRQAPAWPARIVADGLVASAGEGRLSLDGEWDLAADTFRLKTNATGWPVHPLRLPDTPPDAAPIDIAGRVDLSLAGQGRLSAPVATGRFSLEDVRYGDVRPGRLEGSLDAKGDGLLRVQAAAPALPAAAEATVAVTAPFAYQASVTVSDFDLRRLGETGLLDQARAGVADGTLSARIRAEGTLEDPASSTLVADLEAYNGLVYGVPVTLEAPATVRVSSAELSSEGLAFRTGATKVLARGTLGRGEAGRFAVDVTGRVEDLLPALAKATGRGAVGSGTLALSLAAVGGIDAPRLTGRVSLTDVSLQADLMPGLTVFALDAELDGGTLDLRHATGRLGGAEVSAAGVVPLQFLQGLLPDRLLQANPSTGDATLRLSANKLTLAALGRLAGVPPGDDIAGDFDLRAELHAKRPSLDAVTGTVWVDRGTVTTNEITLTQVGRADIELRDATARFEEWRWAGGRSDIALRGLVDFGGSRVSYEVEARGPVDLATLGPVFPGRTAGTLRLDVRAAGEGDRHGVTGELVLAGGTWIDRDLQVAVTDTAGVIRLRGDRALVDGITGRLNGGDVVVRGEVSRGEAEYPVKGALSVTARGVTLEYPPRVVNDVDADLQVVAPGPRGTLAGITGKALVRPGALRASLLELASIFATTPPVPPTPESERRDLLMAGIGLDIAIDTVDDFVADGNDLRAQMGASVRLTGTLAQPGMLGRADIREDGELFLAGRLYQLRGGRIDFVDASRIDPRLTLLGRTVVSQYEVELQLTGPVQRLDVRLRSNPPLSQADLASLLTTGQTLKERRENTAEASSDLARTQLLSLVSSEYLGRMGRYLGVDTVRIEQTTRDLSAVDLDPVARLSVAKSFGARLELTYSQSLQESDDIAWILRFRPGWRSVEAKSTFETSGGETYEVRQELEFGGGYNRPRTSSTQRKPRVRVSSVTIEGVPDAEAAALRERLALSPGDWFDVFRWQRDRERIERHFRERQRLRTTVSAARRPSEAGDEVALSYGVDMGPVVSLRVEGAELGGDTREALRTAWAESSIDLFVDQTLEETVRLALAREGYLQASVEATVSPTTEDQTEAVIRVDRGRRSTVRALVFAGNRSVGSETLEALVEDTGLGDRVWVEPASAVGPIATAYAAAGFLNARVEPGRPTFDGERATLPIVIREGRPFSVGAVEVLGAVQVPEAELRRAFGLDAGRPYTSVAAADGAEAVRALYARQGHSEAQVRLETRYDRERSTARLRLAVEEGVRRNVTDVVLAGDIATRPGLTAPALAVPGEGPVDMREVEDAQRRLYDLGVFRSVEPRFEPTGKAVEVEPGALVQPVRVVFDVEEYARYRLRYGFQVATGTQSTRDLTTTGTRPGVTVDLRRNNLFGLGFDVGGGGFFTVDRSRLRGIVQSSTLGGKPVQTTLSVTREATEGQSGLLSVVQERTLLAAEQRWRPSRRVEFAYGYDLEYDDADLTFSMRDAEPLLLTLRARLASLNTTSTYDSRDNLLDPTRGMFHSTRLEAGTGWVGSELRFARYLGQHFLFVPAGRLTWASGLRFGTVGIDDAQEESLESILVRFSTGGGTTVRGYEQDALTPTIIEGIPRGGDVLVVINQEARVRLAKWFGVVGFVDAGNAFAGWQDVSWSGLKVGIGTGLRITTPIGVLRLDLGIPRSRVADQPDRVWYFSFGHAF